MSVTQNLIQIHRNELQQVQAQLFALGERRDQLCSILATLAKVEEDQRQLDAQRAALDAAAPHPGVPAGQ